MSSLRWTESTTRAPLATRDRTSATLRSTVHLSKLHSSSTMTRMMGRSLSSRRSAVQCRRRNGQVKGGGEGGGGGNTEGLPSGEEMWCRGLYRCGGPCWSEKEGFWCPVPVLVRTDTQTHRETYRETHRGMRRSRPKVGGRIHSSMLRVMRALCGLVATPRAGEAAHAVRAAQGN
jgi:hypothetical protein